MINNIINNMNMFSRKIEKKAVVIKEDETKYFKILEKVTRVEASKTMA